MSKFKIDSDESADWYLGSLARMRQEKALLQAQHEARIKQVDNDIKSLEFVFQHQMEEYIKSRLKGSRRRSLILPHGTVGFRKSGQKIVLRDKVDAMEYLLSGAESRPSGLIREQTIQSIDAEKYKEYAEQVLIETGVVLPGIDIQPEQDNFYIKTGDIAEDE